MLLTTHYLEEADRLAGRLIIVDRGRVVAEGCPRELKAELQGDTVTVELTEPDRRAAPAVAKVPEVLEVADEGRRIRARVSSGATAVPLLLQTLQAAGIGTASVTIARPSLDDVYLRHTGTPFAEDHRAGRHDRARHEDGELR